MQNGLEHLCSGITGVLKYEGVSSLVSRGFMFFLRKLFLSEKYYAVYLDLEHIPEEDEVEFLPRTNNFCLKLITTNKEADVLITDGYVFGAYELNVRISLDKGAIAFCIFVDKELASLVFLADNEQGKEAIDYRPFTVDFKNGEIVTGKVLTVPKFRRLHLRHYSGYVIRKFCRERGIKRIAGTILTNNYPVMSDNTLSNHQYATSRCLFTKILWLKYFKETKMEPTTKRQIFEQGTARREEKQTE